MFAQNFFKTIQLITCSPCNSSCEELQDVCPSGTCRKPPLRFPRLVLPRESFVISFWLHLDPSLGSAKDWSILPDCKLPSDVSDPAQE